MAAVLLYVSCVFVVWNWYPIRGVTAESSWCPRDCECLGNYVDCSSRGLIEVPKDLRPWVTYLELQNNAISTIHEDDFKDLVNLEELDLRNNEIRFINETVFEHLPALKQLKINNNKLAEIPKLKRNVNLTVLEINHNRIHTINSDALRNLPRLEVLEINHNQIMDIPVGTFPAGLHLKKLSLNSNNIFTFGKGSLDNLTSLESLRLNKNHISDIPKDLFSKLVNLRQLEMTKNQISRIDSLFLNGLENLQVLKLRKNSLSQLLDGAFWVPGVSKLQNLQLDHNNITEISKGWLYGLKALRQLSLAHNNIHSIEKDGWGPESCEQLQQLDLTNNKLTTISSEAFKKLRHLRVLLLNDNKVANIDDGAFKDLTSLEVLEMNNNQISWTVEDMHGAFTGLENLNRLGLQKNRIQSITKRAFSGLVKLKELHLQNNNITSIQSNAFEPMKELRVLAFNSSSLLCDCQLEWLPSWLRTAEFDNSVIAVCAHPETLKGKSIFAVDPSLFKCDGDFPKPFITQEPKSQIALKGADITLNCSAASTTGNSQTHFTWKKDNIMLTDPVLENTAKSNGNIIEYTSRLTLVNVQDEANGRYQCIISNEFGSGYSKRADISVHVYPKFMKAPVDVTVKAGTTARLECAATGQPPPVVAWQKDGGDDFPAARERRMHMIPHDDVFFIVNVKRSDEGTYSCRAQNAAGTIIANASLTVLQKPSFVKPMEDKKTKMGLTTVLECMTAGSPKPSLQWLKDGKELAVTERHFFTAENQLLVIVNTSPGDAGEYTCVMTNTLGMERGTSQLVVVHNNAAGMISGPDNGLGGLDDESTTTGIIIIAVVCCVVGTSLVWVIIIYQTRKRHELYSATPTDETTLPGELPSSGYNSSDKEGSFTQNGPMTVPGYHYQDFQMKESGYESSSGQFRAARSAAIFPSDVDEDEQQPSVPLMYDKNSGDANSADNSESSLHYPNSETDSVKSSHSTNSTHTSGQQTLRTFHPQLTNHDTLGRDNTCVIVCECCGQVESRQTDGTLPPLVHACQEHCQCGSVASPVHSCQEHFQGGVAVSAASVHKSPPAVPPKPSVRPPRHHSSAPHSRHHGSQPPGGGVRGGTSELEEIHGPEELGEAACDSPYVPCPSSESPHLPCSRFSPVHSSNSPMRLPAYPKENLDQEVNGSSPAPLSNGVLHSSANHSPPVVNGPYSTAPSHNPPVHSCHDCYACCSTNLPMENHMVYREAGPQRVNVNHSVHNAIPNSQTHLYPQLSQHVAPPNCVNNARPERTLDL